LKSLPGRIGISGPSGNMWSGMQTDKKQSIGFFWVFEYNRLKHTDFGG